MVGAASTVISSGDNESHSHPRPTIVAASGHVGHTKIDADKMATPLVYATEIARSVRLGRPTKVRGIRALPDGTSETVEFEPSRVEIDFEEQRAGDEERTDQEDDACDLIPQVRPMRRGRPGIRRDRSRRRVGGL